MVTQKLSMVILHIDPGEIDLTIQSLMAGGLSDLVPEIQPEDRVEIICEKTGFKLEIKDQALLPSLLNHTDLVPIES